MAPPGLPRLANSAEARRAPRALRGADIAESSLCGAHKGAYHQQAGAAFSNLMVQGAYKQSSRAHSVALPNASAARHTSDEYVPM